MNRVAAVTLLSCPFCGGAPKQLPNFVQCVSCGASTATMPEGIAQAAGAWQRRSDSTRLSEEKLFYERFWALHRNPLLVSIYSKFGIGVFRRSSVLEGFADFLEAQQFSGGRCVEIGTCKGLTALVLARRFTEVVSIDVVDDPDRERIAAAFGVTNVRFVTVADNDAKRKVIEGLTFDAAYLDGDHARDTAFDFDLVKRCGLVLFHEYWPAQPPVFDLVNTLKASGAVAVHGKLAIWAPGRTPQGR